MAKSPKRAFSLYDIEQYLRDAGAEKVNEKAVLSFEEELASTVKDIVNEAQIYANHAGRNTLIKREDLELVGFGGTSKGHRVVVRTRPPARRRKIMKRARLPAKPVINVRMARQQML